MDSYNMNMSPVSMYSFNRSQIRCPSSTFTSSFQGGNYKDGGLESKGRKEVMEERGRERKRRGALERGRMKVEMGRLEEGKRTRRLKVSAAVTFGRLALL